MPDDSLPYRAAPWYRLLHELWTSAATGSGYHKRTWQDLETACVQLADRASTRMSAKAAEQQLLVDRVTNAVDGYIRDGGAEYEELSAIVATAVKGPA